ncbi:MAG: ATP-binding cassette domain-containing protein [Candidatus Nanopelagicales bacterium]
MNSGIRFEHVSVRYPGAPQPTLRDVDLTVPEGELVLVIGRTGSGKSTLLRCINGLVPHFSGGTLSGRVVVDGRDTRTHPPRELADAVGVVGQDPIAGFVCEIVEDELAYGMECLGVAPDVMRRRVEETLDLLGLAPLRNRPLTALSGGQRQRVAIGAALTTHPRILVLDEPTSALDPGAAEEVLAALQRLVHDLGMTVVLAEHRLERVVQYADRVLVVEAGRVTNGEPAQMMVGAPVAPPVVELGRLAGWDPLPLSVRDARRAAGPLRARLRALPPLAVGSPDGPIAHEFDRGHVRLQHLAAGYGRTPVLRGIDLDVEPGEVLALMGRNGSGKSTLLAAMAGMLAPTAGSVRIGGSDPARLVGQSLIKAVGLVPQEPTDLLYATAVVAECAAADATAGVAPGTAARLLADIAPGIPTQAHPRDLSEGQRLALALSVVLAADPPVVLLDEPTRGLDYGAKRRLIRLLHGLRSQGHAVVMATHDVELVAEVATRVAVLADGEVVADGSTGQVVSGSPLFAPQVAKILTPDPWLTVGQVAHALAASG